MAEVREVVIEVDVQAGESAQKLAEVKRNIAEGGPIAGCNFWGWSGSGRPSDLVWQAGDDYLCDPPHEPQGWYSVFDCDTSTINIIKAYSTL